jgi:hypothetical protein
MKDKCEVCKELIDLKSWKRHQDKHKSEITMTDSS